MCWIFDRNISTSVEEGGGMTGMCCTGDAVTLPRLAPGGSDGHTAASISTRPENPTSGQRARPIFAITPSFRSGTHPLSDIYLQSVECVYPGCRTMSAMQVVSW